MSRWSPRVWLTVWCVVAVVLRLMVMFAAPEQLVQDRDLYLGIAQELRAGHGYATPGSDPPRPTAFRPPLYPLLLATTGGNPIAIGGVQLLLAVCTVLAIGDAANRLAGCSPLWVIAPAVVAVDPLLLLYSRQPMTETLCACLSTVLIWRVACRDERVFRWKSACGEGFVWGLCLLSRPTYGAALAIWVVAEIYRFITRRVHDEGTEARRNTGNSGTASSSPLTPEEGLGVRVCNPRATLTTRVRLLILVVTVALLTLSPWAIRNWRALGHPILTTTHGGYTLLLANNPVFYHEVIDGTAEAWGAASLASWQSEIDQRLDQSGIQGEYSRDQVLSKEGWGFIRKNPGRFMRACLFRAGIFWGLTPSRTAGEGQNLPMLWAVGGFYLALWVGGIASLIRLIRTRSLSASAGLSTAFCLILGFFLVHLVYWTDVRMRAPIMPAVALFVAAAWGSASRPSPPHD